MKTNYIISFLLIVCLTGIEAQYGKDKLGSLRTSKKIVSVTALPTSDDYAIQVIALKEPAAAPGFFKNIDQAREFRCADGFVRYTVGSFSDYNSAKAEIIYYKDLGYVQAFVVNTPKYKNKIQ